MRSASACKRSKFKTIGSSASVQRNHGAKRSDKSLFVCRRAVTRGRNSIQIELLSRRRELNHVIVRAGRVRTALEILQTHGMERCEIKARETSSNRRFISRWRVKRGIGLFAPADIHFAVRIGPRHEVSDCHSWSPLCFAVFPFCSGRKQPPRVSRAGHRLPGWPCRPSDFERLIAAGTFAHQEQHPTRSPAATLPARSLHCRRARPINELETHAAISSDAGRAVGRITEFRAGRLPDGRRGLGTFGDQPPFLFGERGRVRRR